MTDRLSDDPTLTIMANAWRVAEHIAGRRPT